MQSNKISISLAIVVLLLLGAIPLGCASGNSHEATLVEIPMEALTLHPEEGMLYQGESPFTGTSVEYHPGGEVARKTNYQKGKRDGMDRKWFVDGRLSYEATYVANKLEGTARSWWKNGQLRSESRFVAAKAEGVQKQWYKSGALFKEMNLEAGQEAGMQRAYRENGDLYVNYEARNGRFFGLRRGTLCYGLSEEDIVLRDETIKRK